MTEDEFADALDCWGGDLQGWRPEDRSAALSLLERSAGARAELRAMQTTERALLRTGAQAASLADPMLALVSAKPQQRSAWLGSPAKAAALTAAILAAGFWYGALKPPPPADWFGIAFAAEVLDVR